MNVSLKLVNGEEIEAKVDSNSFIIGRSSTCDVVVPHEGMSRRHCQIEVIDGELFVTDLGSTNGVLIDGKRIEPNKKIPYATFLPLSFGAVQSLQITDDPTGTIHVDYLKERSLSQKNKGTGTSTKGMAQKEKTGSHPKVTASDPGKVKFIAMNLLILMLLGCVAWWYMNKEETSTRMRPAPSQNGEQDISSDQF